MDAPPRPARTPLVFAALALALVPWSALLLVYLPSAHVARHWDVAWGGFDIGLAAALGATAFAALRGAPWLQGAAAAAGTLLVCDSWFDVLTAGSGAGFWLALGEAIAAELPLAALCFLVAADAARALAFAASAGRYRRRAR